MSKLLIATGADHGGYKMKKDLVKHLKKNNFSVIDFGPSTNDPVDYPDYAKRVAKNVLFKKSNVGILVC